MSAPIYVIGAAMTPFGLHVALDVKELTRWMVTEALADPAWRQPRLTSRSSRTRPHGGGLQAVEEPVAYVTVLAREQG
jgi:hypothetical protein